MGFLFLTLVALSALIPVAPVPAWLTEDLILRWFALGLLLVCSALIFNGSFSPKVWTLGLADTLVLALTAWALLSASNSDQVFDSLYALKNLLVIVLLWFSLRTLWELFPELYPRFENVFWTTSVISALWLIISTAGHFFMLPFFQNIVPREGFFINQNIAAGYLGLALVFALLRMIRQERVPLINFLIVLAGWGCTQSRGAFLSMVLVVVIYAVLNTREIEKTLTAWTSGQWSRFMIIVGLAVLASVPMINRIFHAVDMDPRAYFRVYVWVSAIHMALAQPLWGFGPGTFGVVYPIYRSGSLWNTATPFAHNEYLQVAAECGLPALALTLVLLWALVVQFRRHFQTVSIFKKLTAEAKVSEFAFYMIILEACHNFVDFTANSWPHQLVLLGFVTYALKKKDADEDLNISLKLSDRFQWAAVAALLLVSFWTLGVGAFRDYSSQMENFKSVLLERAGDLQGAEERARRSIQWQPNNMNPWNCLGAIEDARAASSLSPVEKEKHFNEAKKDFDEASRLSPYAMTPIENEVQDLLKRGRLFEALDLEKSLIDKAPEDPSHYLSLSLILMKLHRPQDALAPIQQALDIDDYYLPAQLLKGQILEALGKKQEALKTYNRAQAILNELQLKDPSGELDSRIKKLQSELK